MSSGALFEQMQGRRWRRQSDFRVVTTLSLVFSSQLQYFWCKKGRTIAAFANSFHPLVCHLWEAKEKKSKDFSGTLRVKKLIGSSSRGRPVWCFFSFWISERLSFFLESTKHPQRQALADAFAAIPFLQNGVAGRFDLLS